MLWAQGPATSWNRTFFSLDPGSIIAHPESKSPAWGSVLLGDSCPVLPTCNIRILTTMVIVRIHMFRHLWGKYWFSLKTVFPIVSCKLDVAVWLRFGYWNAKRNGVCNFWKVLFHLLPFFFFWLEYELWQSSQIMNWKMLEVKCGAMRSREPGSHPYLGLSVSRLMFHRRTIKFYLI